MCTCITLACLFVTMSWLIFVHALTGVSPGMPLPVQFPVNLAGQASRFGIMCMLRQNTDMTSARQNSQLAGARAQSITHCTRVHACLLFYLFSRPISGTQSFQENHHVFVALKLLVSLIGRLIACSARISVERQIYTDRPSTVTLAAHAHRGFISMADYFYKLGSKDNMQNESANPHGTTN